MATSANAGGVVREVIRTGTASLHAGGVVREIIRASTPQARISGVVREVLVEDVPQARVSGVRREVLLVDQPDKWVLGPRWPRRMAVIEEPENDPDFEALALIRYRRRVSVAPKKRVLRPFVSINI
jgi:hypothetical protein